MEAAIEWALDTILRYPATTVVLIIVLVGSFTGFLISRDIRESQNAAAEASANRVQAFWDQFWHEEERRKRDAIAWTGKEEP